MAENKAASKTTKTAQVGAHLRVERDARGITLTKFAEEVGVSKSHMSRIENGLVSGLKIEDWARMFTLLGVDRDRFDTIMRMVNGDGDQHGWIATSLGEQAAMNVALVNFEADARSITDGALVLIPGLCQRPDYTRAIMSGGTVPPSEINTRVAMRAGRTAVIDPGRTSKPVAYTALIDEAALRKHIGGRDVMVDQLRHLHVIATTWTNATILVVPDSAGWYPGMSGAFSMIEPSDKDALTIVHLSTRRTGQILDSDEDLKAYANTVEAGVAAAMDKDASAERIAAAITEMETG